MSNYAQKDFSRLSIALLVVLIAILFIFGSIFLAVGGNQTGDGLLQTGFSWQQETGDTNPFSDESSESDQQHALAEPSLVESDTVLAARSLPQRSGGAGVYAPLGGNTLLPGDEARLVVMAVMGDPGEGYYQAYPATAAGLTSALTDLFHGADSQTDYIVYIGANIIGGIEARFANTGAAGTFSGLAGRVNGLVLTGSPADPVTDTAAMTAAAAGSRTFLTGGTSWFGSHITLRNLRHDLGAIVYMNGYDLTLAGNSWQLSATSYYGGAANGSIVPANETVHIQVYSTGVGDSTFFGGMNVGTINGNTAVSIYGTSGNLLNVRGGGNGTSSVARANVTGDVSTTITGMATNTGGLNSFLGGVNFGDIGGRVTNTISGPGRFGPTLGSSTDAAVGAGHFVGGSRDGSIGGAATAGGSVDTSNLANDYSELQESSDYVLKNDIDTSRYTAGRKYYIGANTVRGTITGNIINIVKAGGRTSGGYTGLQAVGGYGTSITLINETWATGPGSFVGSLATGRVSNVEVGRARAEAAAGFRVYGNVTNIVRSGHISELAGPGYFRGAGCGGYIKGNIYSAIGTDGLVYQRDANSYAYRVSATAAQATQGRSTDFDLVGGGGIESNSNSICIVGDTTLVLKEVRARWTYGASFGGVLIGDSHIELHSGVVDTLEGAGYDTYVFVGDSRAEVHGGQVEWFLSGGGWNDHWHDGNVSVEVMDTPPPHTAIINASMGGTYGASARHYTSGDSKIVIRGGDFRGVPADVPIGFSAGPTNAGTIFGNAYMTIDLRGNRYGFATTDANAVSAGRSTAASAASILGTNRNNTIELNIFTDDANTDLLSGMNIYGDSFLSGTSDNTRAGRITMNINAPDSSIGNLFATSYENLTGTGASRMLLRDVEINLVSAGTIKGLSSGNGFTGTVATDNTLTNAIAAQSAAQGRRAVINVGPQSDDPEHPLAERESYVPADGLPREINVGGVGVTGFTEMNINRRLLLATAGTIKNGGSRAALETYGEYDQFGHITVQAGEGIDAAGFGMVPAGSSLIVAGDLKAVGAGHAYIQSPGAQNQAILSRADIEDQLVWLRVGNTAASAFPVPSTYFTAYSGWHVFTLNPDRTRVAHINSDNLIGIDRVTGRAFLGDNVIPATGNNGFAICVPAEYFVIPTGLNTATGHAAVMLAVTIGFILLAGSGYLLQKQRQRRQPKS
ncbi:MAG: hypothetical protein FWF11_00925 [Coriobacteriia bacterium]|nr:hypothetical protein [Coriobacteriia bacterium]